MTQMAQEVFIEGENNQQSSPRRWPLLILLLVATFMSSLDSFIVNVAVPSIEKGLQATFAEAQLVIAGYTLGYAVWLTTGGRLGDLYGRKRLFLVGVFGFTLFSALCGLAPDILSLIVFRLFQGVFAALVTPQVIATLQTSFDGEERTTAFSAYSIAIGIAAIFGQAVGGLLLSTNILGLGWRMIFLVNVPIGIITVLATWPLIPESRLTERPRFDPFGVMNLFCALVLLIYPLAEGGNEGWPRWSFACLAIALVLLVLFVAYEHQLERRNLSPLVPLELFRSRAFVAGTLSIMLNSMLFAAVMLVLAFYLQNGLHNSPLQSSVAMMVMGASFLLASGATPGLVRRFGLRALHLGAVILIIGYLLMGLAALFFVPTYGPVPLFIAGFLGGCGNGIILPQLMNKAMGDIRPQMIGAASGVYSTLPQVANALGVAAIGVLFSAVLTSSASYSLAFAISLLVIGVFSVGQLLLAFVFPKEGTGDTPNGDTSLKREEERHPA